MRNIEDIVIGICVAALGIGFVIFVLTKIFFPACRDEIVNTQHYNTIVCDNGGFAKVERNDAGVFLVCTCPTKSGESK